MQNVQNNYFFHMMFNKQNKVPTKQGALYELSLGKDSGPYLSKDIMYSNPKSIALLAGSQIVKSFSSFNQSMNISESKQKQCYQTLSHSENMNSRIQLLEEQITSNITKSNKLRVEEFRLRHEFNMFNDSITQINAHLFDQYMPLLRGLYKGVKQQASLQKEQIFKMEKQIRQIGDAKRHLIQGIFKCEQKIIEIEKMLDYSNAKRQNETNN